MWKTQSPTIQNIIRHIRSVIADAPTIADALLEGIDDVWNIIHDV